MRRQTAARFKELGVGLVQDLRVPVASFSGGQRQSVAIARAAMWAQHVIIMDEPTAALGVIQTAKVLDLIRTRPRSRAWRWCSSRTTCARCWRSPTGSRSCVWVPASPGSAAGEADIERLIASISGAYANEVVPA